jgi:hypothetical protein
MMPGVSRLILRLGGSCGGSLPWLLHRALPIGARASWEALRDLAQESPRAIDASARLFSRNRRKAVVAFCPILEAVSKQGEKLSRKLPIPDESRIEGGENGGVLRSADVAREPEGAGRVEHSRSKRARQRSHGPQLQAAGRPHGDFAPPSQSAPGPPSRSDDDAFLADILEDREVSAFCHCLAVDDEERNSDSRGISAYFVIDRPELATHLMPMLCSIVAGVVRWSRPCRGPSEGQWMNRQHH